MDIQDAESKRETSFYEHKLTHRDIKPTAMRMLILRTMMRGNEAVSLPDLERLLLTVDKSTISRTLTLFHEHRLIHTIDDGSGAVKYAVCSDDCDCSVSMEHTHFYCEVCHRTFCFEQQAVPVVQPPSGFKVDSINYVMKGCCPECSLKTE